MKQENEKAKIIAFCGIDGSGKSTQLKLVRDYLSKDAKVLVAKMSYSPLNRMGDNKIFDLALKGYSGLKIISYYYDLQHKDVFNYDYTFLECYNHLFKNIRPHQPYVIAAILRNFEEANKESYIEIPIIVEDDE